MIALQGQIDIDATPDRVYAYLTDFANLSEWQKGVHGTEVLTEGPVRVGTRFKESFDLVGRRVEMICEVSDVQAGRAVSYGSVSKGSLEYQGSFVMEPREEGTTLRYSATTKTHGLLRILEPFVRREFEREATTEFQQIKRFVEARAAAAG